MYVASGKEDVSEPVANVWMLAALRRQIKETKDALEPLENHSTQADTGDDDMPSLPGTAHEASAHPPDGGSSAFMSALSGLLQLPPHAPPHGYPQYLR